MKMARNEQTGNRNFMNNERKTWIDLNLQEELAGQNGLK